MKIAILTTDSREHFCQYTKQTPYFGTAPQGLICGFAEIGDQMSEAGSHESVEIHVISCTQRPMSSPEKLADNIWFHSLHVPKWGWLKSGYLGCILAVRKKLRKIQPDLIHAQGTERDCAISAIFTPYPKLLTIHGNLRLIRQTIGFRPLSAMWFQTFIEGFVVPRFDGVVCITNYTKKAIEHEAKKTWVIPNAVDPAFLSLGEERQIKDRRSDIGSQPTPTSDLRPPSSTIPAPIVLVVANVDARKNQSNFILALDALAKKTPFQAKFFGRCSDDDYGREFHRLVSERTWCQYGGMISRDELRREFASATVLALPTHEDNCPMVVLEAQAAAIPVMASNVGGVPDLVENEVTGLLTDPNRPESMSAALQRLLQEPALVNDLARNGRLQAQQRFHPEVIAAAHLEIYAEVIASQRK